MNSEEKESWGYVFSKMKHEGFHYCFFHYSNFKEIEDEKFHSLRTQYLQASIELENYVIQKAQEEAQEEAEEEMD